MTKNIARNTVVLALSAFAGGVFAAPAATQAPFEERIQTAIEQAAERGIPAGMLESKVSEGIAKGVPADRILHAVERRAEALGRAQSAFERAGKSAERAELAAGANALEGGVSEAALSTIAETSPENRRLVAISVLTELVSQGKVPEEALAQVEEALARGPGALADLPEQAAAARDRGGMPAGVGPGQVGPPAQIGPPAGSAAGADQQRGRRGPPSN